MAEKKSHLKSLNGIRGFAVLLVLVSHAANDGLIFCNGIRFSGAGHYGVFLFFVLSAFLLTRQFLVAEQGRGFTPAGMGHYFVRRFLRIYPLFTAALIVYYMLNRLGLLIIPVSEEMIVKSLFLLDAEGIFWTIPVEFQFYFILPFVAFLLYLQSSRLAVLLEGILFCWVWTVFFPPQYTKNLMPFLPIFIIGAISAWLYVSLTKVKKTKEKSLAGNQMLNNIMAMVMLLLFIVLIPDVFDMIVPNGLIHIDFQHQYILFGCISSGLILFTLFSEGPIRFLMESRFFVFWGNVSFSAYLGHKIVLSLVNEFENVPMLLRFVLFFAVTALFSYLSFQYFERPLAGLYNNLKKPVIT